MSEVEHQSHRIEHLEQAIDDAVEQAPPKMRTVIDALQALRGVAKVTAVTLAVEVGRFERFEHPKQLMSYVGMVPSEHSSGGRRQQGSITKTGNAHLRRVLVEAAWHYRHQPRLSTRQKKLQSELPPVATEIAWKAQLRLNRRHWRLSNRSKPSAQVVTALAR
jgi:transposase